ncbi:MAG: transporter substrate-binding domain-containing protein, partial [Microcoleaceae cyanobacterium]
TNQGLLYSPPFAGTVINNTPLKDNDKRNLLEEIADRGYVKIGVSGVSPGFSLNKDGEWSGIDVDLGRALAAAVFGNAKQIEFVTQSFQEGFSNVANGKTDVSAMSVTQNLMRDAAMGIDFGPTYLYTGQGILVRKDSGIASLPMLNGRKIGILSGTTAEQNLSDALVRTGVDFIPVEYATGAELLEAYDKGVIDAISWDIAILNANLSELTNPEEHRLLDEILSKEPMSLIIDENQSSWGDVVRWVNYALMQAEEWGITQDNVDDFVANSEDPQIKRFLGLIDNLGEQLGLPNDYAYQIIKAVGNYAEVYGRNFSTDIMRRASNEEYRKAGLLFSPPLGSTVSDSNITPPDNTNNNAVAVGDVDDTDDQFDAPTTTTPNTPNQPNDNTDVNTPDNNNFLVNQVPANRLPLPDVDNPLGYQVLLGTDQPDVLTNANTTNDLILTFRGNDMIDGEADNDVIYAGKDDDLVSGNSGDDIIYGDNGDDTIAGNDGNDWLNGNRDEDIVSGDVGNDTVDGGKGNDTMNGGLGDDTVYGGEGNDLMLGGDGNDLLITDQGDDTLTGGLGNDLFALTDEPGINLITDFT